MKVNTFYRDEIDHAEEAKLADAMKADGYKPTTKKIDMSQLFQILTVKSPESKCMR